VWIPLEGGTGGTTVGGDGGNLGYWAPQQFQEPYTVRVIDRYETQSYTVNVVDRYESRVETYRRFDRYDTVPRSRQVPMYRTETQTYQQEIFHDESKTGTRTIYDREAVYATRVRTDYIAAVRQSTRDVELPENGLACQGSITVTGNLVYRDAEGDTAYVNGMEPWLPYEPNSAYDGHSIFGIIAQQNILYSRQLPDNAELNASMLAIKGRVGIEGIVLDDQGEVSAFNQLLDDFGRPVNQVFRKNSIRRLGGITTAKRPVETVVQEGSIRSGFNVGQSVFDIGLLEGPPPFFLAYPIPRFFSTTIVK
jgi:hypothetical protein